MNVLYLHHTASYGGSGKSLYELIVEMKKYGVNATIICPKGPMAAHYLDNDIEVIPTIGLPQFDNTRYGYYHSFRWLILLREIFYITFAIHSLIKARKIIKKIDIVHINEYTMLPTAILAHFILKCPLVIHCRSLQRNSSESIRFKVIDSIYDKIGAKIVAIDLAVKSTLNNSYKVDVIHNSLKSINKDVGLKETEEQINTKEKIIEIGFVGQIGIMKGIEELLLAVKICQDESINVHLKITGKFESESYGILKNILYFLMKRKNNTKENILKIIQENNIKNRVTIQGFNKNLNQVYSEIDVLCFASRLNAPGRPVFEAGFYGKPSIVAVDQSWSDAIVHGETGLIVPKNSPIDIYNAVRYFYENPNELVRMGENARILANKNFDPETNAKLMMDVYQGMIG